MYVRLVLLSYTSPFTEAALTHVLVRLFDIELFVKPMWLWGDARRPMELLEVTTADELQPRDWTRTLTPSIRESDWGDARRPMELMRWRLLTRINHAGLHTNSDLQVFVRVTVRGRPTTNGAHEVTTADEHQPCGTAHELWPPSVRESDCEGTPDDQWSSWGDDCWRASTLRLHTNCDPKCSWEWLWGDARRPMELTRWWLLTKLQPWDCTRTLTSTC